MPAHFHKTDKPISGILEEVDLAIYSSSIVGLEALLAGVPVIRYESEHILELDPLGTCGEWMVKSCSGDNLKQVVLSALNETSDHPDCDFASNVNKFLSPVNEDVWRQIIRV